MIIIHNDELIHTDNMDDVLLHLPLDTKVWEVNNVNY